MKVNYSQKKKKGKLVTSSGTLALPASHMHKHLNPPGEPVLRTQKHWY